MVPTARGSRNQRAEETRARAGACARARERRDSESFGAGRQVQGGTGEVNDEKPRVKWSARRIITFVILLLILALVIYLKVTGVV